MKLYSYWRSTTSYRTRIALNVKQISYEPVYVNLVKGEQLSDEFTEINPSKGVPALELTDGTVLTQSMAIISYLEAIKPTPALLPKNPVFAAEVNAAAYIIAMDIHPINNLKVTRYLKSNGMTDDDAKNWMKHWMSEGFIAYQELIDLDGDYSFGDTVSLADICLIPQLYNAHRWGVDLTPFARLLEIEQKCLALPEFKSALPENQLDAYK